jgi:hypothetical protein
MLITCGEYRDWSFNSEQIGLGWHIEMIALGKSRNWILAGKGTHLFIFSFYL